MKRIVVSVISDLVTDQRVHKTAAFLHEEGADVLLVGRKLPDSLPVSRPYKVSRLKLWFRKGPFLFAEFNIRLFFFLLFKRMDVLVANDLDTLLANFLVAKIRRKELVYDTHEYYTGMPELTGRPVVRKIWETLERLTFPHLKYIYTVNGSIARLYREKYGKNLAIVRNIPQKIVRDKWPERSELELPEDKRIVILQGSGINMNRGAEEAIMAMKYLDAGVILLIIGGGEVYTQLIELVNKEYLHDRVIFKPRMPYDELMSYTRVSDIGLSLDKDTNINYRYSLPNKLFDYIQAGVPILCSNLVEVANIVNTWDIGVVTNSHDPENIAAEITRMLHNKEQYHNWKINLEKAAQTLHWENERHKLEEIYSPIIR
ncbi:MAG TPA: glycosyltransferase [Bacteroidales bacterium]|nr:glycosyltransferase [Bacteroidales bacterium]